MRCYLSLLVLLAAMCVWSQPQTTELIAITPDTVVATVNGQKLTAGELERMTQNLSPDLQRLAGLEPQKFLDQHALANTLRAEAERLGIAQKSPYREQIEKATREILINGMMAEKGKQINFSEEELRKVYDGRRTDYRQATVKVIFISRIGFVHNLGDNSKRTITPEEAKQKASDIAKQAREGADFVALAKQHSDDRNSAEKKADFPYPIKAGAGNIPQEVRTALFEAKPDDIVGPVEHDTGFYIFRVESQTILPFESAKADIEKQLRAAAVDKWLDEMKKKSTATLDHKPFWDTFVAANKEALEARKKEAAK
jgi:parvulin-like peptidyl-prolyl isomerase